MPRTNRRDNYYISEIKGLLKNSQSSVYIYAKTNFRRQYLNVKKEIPFIYTQVKTKLKESYRGNNLADKTNEMVQKLIMDYFLLLKDGGNPNIDLYVFINQHLALLHLPKAEATRTSEVTAFEPIPEPEPPKPSILKKIANTFKKQNKVEPIIEPPANRASTRNERSSYPTVYPNIELHVLDEFHNIKFIDPELLKEIEKKSLIMDGTTVENIKFRYSISSLIELYRNRVKKALQKYKHTVVPVDEMKGKKKNLLTVEDELDFFIQLVRSKHEKSIFTKEDYKIRKKKNLLLSDRNQDIIKEGDFSDSDDSDNESEYVPEDYKFGDERIAEMLDKAIEVKPIQTSLTNPDEYPPGFRRVFNEIENYLSQRPSATERDLMNMYYGDLVYDNPTIDPMVLQDILNSYIRNLRSSLNLTGSGRKRNNKWITHVKAVQNKHKCTYSQALKLASKTYKK